MLAECKLAAPLAGLSLCYAAALAGAATIPAAFILGVIGRWSSGRSCAEGIETERAREGTYALRNLPEESPRFMQSSPSRRASDRPRESHVLRAWALVGLISIPWLVGAALRALWESSWLSSATTSVVVVGWSFVLGLLHLGSSSVGAA